MPHRFYGWTKYLGEKSYDRALELQRQMVRYRLNGSVRDTFFYLTHPDIITVGREDDEAMYANSGQVEVVKISRGGNVTYHGPGQLVIYPIVDLRRRGKDLRQFIKNLEEGVIRAFAHYDLKCNRHPKHIGVWVNDKKIASIGVAVTRWISYHGVAVNLTTDMEKFKLINPCGLSSDIMTNARQQIGVDIDPIEFSRQLTVEYSNIFDTKFNEVYDEELAEIISMEDESHSL